MRLVSLKDALEKTLANTPAEAPLWHILSDHLDGKSWMKLRGILNDMTQQLEQMIPNPRDFYARPNNPDL